MLITDRLRLRAICPEDATRIAELAGDYDVAKMTERLPFPYEIDAANIFVQSLDDDLIFAIDIEGELIGCCGLAKKPGNGETELGYWIGKPYWGNGYATEAAKAVLKHAFTDLKNDKVVSGHFEDNPASGRVLTKLGFLRTEEACPRYSEARKETVICLGFEMSKARATEVGII